jgi:hypothetical protein
MREDSQIVLTPRMEDAVQELKALITARFPQASFVVEEGFDPEGVYLVTTVDIADTDEVMAVVGDRLLELQVAEGLPLYVTPLRPMQRVVAELREREHATPPSPPATPLKERQREKRIERIEKADWRPPPAASRCVTAQRLPASSSDETINRRGRPSAASTMHSSERSAAPCRRRLSWLRFLASAEGLRGFRTEATGVGRPEFFSAPHERVEGDGQRIC